jgi:hypothetical protein
MITPSGLGGKGLVFGVYALLIMAVALSADLG